ncbi:MAG TPA: hypothetical protein VGO62_04510 [Myxococcota bacterium]
MRTLTKALVVAVAAVALGSLGARLASNSAHPKEIAGLWSLWPDARDDGDGVRFYFFHPDGIGLYRYGKIGLNTTNSFDWKVAGGELVLTFRKTGDVVKTPFSVDDQAHTLTLARDPKEPLVGTVRYTYVPPSAQAAQAPDLVDDAGADARASKVAGRLWIDQKKFATGGMGFSLYQLKDSAIDGRGVGWHHIGDFDDWSTEALTFREGPKAIEFWFTLRGDHGKTALSRSGDTLTLVEDPRGFWHVHNYQDAGPSFGSFSAYLAQRPSSP